MKIQLRIALAVLCCMAPCTGFASDGADDSSKGRGRGDDSGKGRGGGDDSDRDDDKGGDHDSVPDQTVVRGPISAISTTEITVGGLTFTINDATEIKGKNDAPATTADFAAGDFVKVEGSASGDALVAHEIELEDDHDSNDDNHHSRGGDHSNIAVGNCNFPSLELARQSIEKSLRTSFADAGVDARVKVKFRITAKDASQEFTGSSGANGVVLTVDPANGAAVTLSGSITPIPCAGTIAARIEVKPAGASPTVSNATLPIVGEFGARNSGHR